MEKLILWLRQEIKAAEFVEDYEEKIENPISENSILITNIKRRAYEDLLERINSGEFN